MYDEQPVNCLAWKTSFQNTITDIDLYAVEELDLLVKHLGKESAEQGKKNKNGQHQGSSCWAVHGMGTTR